MISHPAAMDNEITSQGPQSYCLGLYSQHNYFLRTRAKIKRLTETEGISKGYILQEKRKLFQKRVLRYNKEWEAKKSLNTLVNQNKYEPYKTISV